MIIDQFIKAVIHYNIYLKDRLDVMYNLGKINEQDMCNLNMELKQELRDIKTIPWKYEIDNQKQMISKLRNKLRSN